MPVRLQCNLDNVQETELQVPIIVAVVAAHELYIYAHVQTLYHAYQIMVCTL